MPVIFQGALPVTEAEANELWAAVREVQPREDDEVVVKVVGAEEMRRLKKEYKGIDEVTNVLTFSYDDAHDVALCVSVAEEEAQERGAPGRDYVAWLLAHAFLHAAGMDHERSEKEAAAMREAEATVLGKFGFRSYYKA